MDETKQSSGRMVVIIAVLSLGIIVALLFLYQPREETSEPVPTSSEWTTAPEDGVEVNLPEAPIRAVPIEPEGNGPANADASDIAEQAR